MEVGVRMATAVPRLTEKIKATAELGVTVKTKATAVPRLTEKIRIWQRLRTGPSRYG